MSEYHTDRFSVVKTPVTITAAPKPATGITLDKTSLALTVGDVEALVATVTPADTTDKVTWASGDDSVATVDAVGKVKDRSSRKGFQLYGSGLGRLSDL